MTLRKAITEYSRWMVALAIRLERDPTFMLRYTEAGVQMSLAMGQWLKDYGYEAKD